MGQKFSHGIIRDFRPVVPSKDYQINRGLEVYSPLPQKLDHANRPARETSAPGLPFVNMTDDPAKLISGLIEGPDDTLPNRGHDDEPPPASARSMGFDVHEINKSYALVLMGSKAVVVQEREAGPVLDRVQILTLDAFRAWFSNKPTEIIASDGKIKTVTWARAWETHRERRQYSGVEFFPNPDGEDGTPGYLNFWRGFSVEQRAGGKYGIFRDHLLNNICGGDQALYRYVFGWFAHMMQRPRERLGTALVLRGAMGSGKTKVGEVFGSLIADHFFQVDDPRYITGQFNAHMAKCLLLQAEEAFWAGDKHAEGRLKGLITSENQMIESKGIDPIRMPNRVRVLMTSNEEWVVPAGKDERRFCVLDVHPRCAQNHDYFREMDDELNNGGRETLLDDLLSFDIDSIHLRQAPRTAALLEQKLRTLEPIESWFYDRLIAGAPTHGGDTWPIHIPVDALYKDYLHFANEIGIGRRRDPATFGSRIRKLVDGIGKSRPRVLDAEGQSRRQQCYELPPLDRCRESFERLLGQKIDWPESAGSEERGADVSDIPI